MAKRPKGTDFFMHEMRNIEREMDYMRKRMDDGMKRSFKSEGERGKPSANRLYVFLISVN